MNKSYLISILVAFAIPYLFGCKKFVDIDPPHDTITSEIGFIDDKSATSNVLGIYSKMSSSSSSFSFTSGSITTLAGLSADELNLFGADSKSLQFKENNLTPDNSLVFTTMWQQAYSLIYQANACIEGLESSTGVSKETKRQLLGECKTIRAFLHFYLVNLFGDIPLVTTSDWRITSTMLRTAYSEVYDQILDDLMEAKDLLLDSYPSPDRVRINKYVAYALLAKVNLYLKRWQDAESYATMVINNNTTYNLESLNNVFLNASSEAIWQILPLNVRPTYNATLEGLTFIPRSNSVSPTFYATPELLNAFEIGDQRKISWLKLRTYQSQTYYYPYKYKVRGLVGNTSITEAYMVFRLGEQYLIRAEARANQNNLSGAINDLNAIRNRAKLTPLLLTLNLGQVLSSVEQERFVELFAEWGNRWLDLKRTERIDAVMSSLKGVNWQNTDKFYPIPSSEIQVNFHLLQNPGYN